MPIDTVNPNEARFPPERIPFSSYEDIANTNRVEIADLTSFTTRTDRYVAYLTDIASLAVDRLFLQAQAQHPNFRGRGGRQQQTLDLDTGALPGIDHGVQDLSLLGVQDLTIEYNNQSGTDQADHRTWGTLTYAKPTALEAVAYSLPRDRNNYTSLIDRFNLEERYAFGDLPTQPIGTEVGYGEQDREYLTNAYRTYNDTPPDKYRDAFTFSTVGVGYMTALAGIAITPQTGATPGDIKVEIVRDGSEVTTLEVYSFPPFGTEVPIWIPAADSITVRITGDGATQVQMRVRYVQFEMTALDWARWYPLDDVTEHTQLSTDEAKQVRDFVRAGIQPAKPGQKQQSGT